MKRRDILKSGLLGVGGVVLGGYPLPKLTAAQAAAAATAAEAAQSGGWKPLLFDEHQNRTVVALTDLIIPATDTPGAKEAGVNAYIDLVVHDGPSGFRNLFLQGLGWLDGYALREHSQSFIQCTPAQQVELLRSLDQSKDPELSPGKEFLAAVKQLTIEGYYTSKIGIAELNKDGVPATFACVHDEHG